MTAPALQRDKKIVACDLDGTLAYYTTFRGPTDIGDPIPAMVQRVRRWLTDGHEVYVFTARAARPEFEHGTRQAIETWCKTHVGVILPITATKRHDFDEFYDDRAVGVEKNTGRLLSPSTRGLDAYDNEQIAEMFRAVFTDQDDVDPELLAPDMAEVCGVCSPKCEACEERSESIQTPGLTADPANPKDLIGVTKLPLVLWPEIATALGSLAMHEGALKYGRSNYRAIPVRARIYAEAARRHMAYWFEGEERAPDSEIDHLGHALACLAIIADARAVGSLIDDRNFKGRGAIEAMRALEPEVARLNSKYAEKSPKHYSIADAPGEE